MAKIRGGVDDLNDHLMRKKPYGKYEEIIVSLLAVLLTISLITVVALVQYETYDSYFKSRNSYLVAEYTPCEIVDYGDINYIMTPIAVGLIIIFIILYKRRSCCLAKCKCSQFGLPMITSLWNKTDRSKTAFVYARIAFEVFLLIQGLFQGTKVLPSISLPPGVTDPTGLFNLLIKIVCVLLIGIRKYMQTK